MEQLLLAVLELRHLSATIWKNEKASQFKDQQVEALAAIVADAEKLQHVGEQILQAANAMQNTQEANK